MSKYSSSDQRDIGTVGNDPTAETEILRLFNTHSREELPIAFVRYSLTSFQDATIRQAIEALSTKGMLRENIEKISKVQNS